MHGERGRQLRGGVLSVVVPTYNEQEVVAEFHGRIAAVLERLDMGAEILSVLKAATYAGTPVALGAFAFGGYVVVKTLVFGEPVSGRPSLIAVITFIGGVQLVAIGIMGEYVARMFEETKGRPIYLVNEYVQARAVAPYGAPAGRLVRDLA